MESESIPTPGNSSGGGPSNRLAAGLVLGVFTILSAGLLLAPRFFSGGELSPEERVDAADALIRTAPAASQGKYTDAELADFGKRIERMIRTGEGTTLRDQFDFDALLDIALTGLDPQNAAVKKFRDQMKLTFRVEPAVDRILGMENSPDDARFVGIRSRDGRKVLLFRYGPFEGVPCTLIYWSTSAQMDSRLSMGICIPTERSFRKSPAPWPSPWSWPKIAARSPTRPPWAR